MKNEVRDFYQMVAVWSLILIGFGLTQCTKSSPVSWTIPNFQKADSVNPILTAGQNIFHCPVLNQNIKWDNKDVFNPAAVVRDGKIWLVFRAEDTIGRYNGTSRIGLAVSHDGLHFTKEQEPVFYPANDSMKIYEWEGGVEDPRVVETEEGQYLMTYTAYDGHTARLCIALSGDLHNWKKMGTVLQGKYKNRWSKSGAVVARREGSRIIATKINGKHWMYFGDTNLFLASSPDLLHWTVLEENNQWKPVLAPRAKMFDSRLVESGPYALLTEKGIVLIYNGMNLNEGGDASLPAGAYCGGQALFDATDPSKLLDRLNNYFIKPDKPYEITGQINQVCFIEGLVWFNNQWLLYYGTADSRIAVAVADGK